MVYIDYGGCDYGECDPNPNPYPHPYPHPYHNPYPSPYYPTHTLSVVTFAVVTSTVVNGSRFI